MKNIVNIVHDYLSLKITNCTFQVVLNGVEYKPNIASNNKKEAKAAAASLCLQKIGLLPTVAPPPPIVPPS